MQRGGTRPSKENDIMNFGSELYRNEEGTHDSDKKPIASGEGVIRWLTCSNSFSRGRVGERYVVRRRAIPGSIGEGCVGKTSSADLLDRHGFLRWSVDLPWIYKACIELLMDSAHSTHRGYVHF